MANNLFFHPSTTILLIFSISITIANATATATATTTTDDSYVLDIEGNPLEVGSAYYVRTELSKVGIGGGLLAASKPNSPQCPQYVAQLSVGWVGEYPLSFFPSDSSQKYISISSDLNIVFNKTTSCSQGAWQLAPDSNSGKLFLSTGGSIGNPGSKTAANWFKIDRSFVQPGLYQLGYCPSSTTLATAPISEVVCGVIDAINEFTDDYRLVWLGLSTETPNFFHLLSFIKA